jgi:ABC-2 type transport system ATP-binding protein
MLQRTGLAAALVADPELLILDEPMSGLDPVGRKEVRDLIVFEQASGRTIFFSTHILSDVEAMCDRVAILRKGKVVVAGRLQDLLKREVKLTDVVIAQPSEDVTKYCEDESLTVQSKGEHRYTISVEGEDALQRLLEFAVGHKQRVVEVVPHHQSLETLFVREAIDAGGTSEPPPAASEPDASPKESSSDESS